MKRRFIYIITIIFSIALIGSISVFASCGKTYKYSELVIDNNSYTQIINERKCLDKAPLNYLKFNDNELFYDKENNTYYYSLVDDNKYNPSMEFDSNYKIAINSKDVSEELIKNNNKIEFIAYDDNNYYKYELVCTTLPLLNININDNLTMITIDLSSDNGKLDSSIKLFDNRSDVDNRNIEYDAYISYRGRSSNNYPKKGYKISIKYKEVEDSKSPSSSLLGLREKGNDYVLYAAYNDQERIRNIFSSNLWYDSCAYDNDLGIENGFQYKYVELFENGTYCGLYALGYQIDEAQEELDSKNVAENIYKKEATHTPEKYFDFDNPYNSGYYSKTNNSSYDSLLEYYDIILNSSDIEEIYDIVDINNSIDMYLFVNLVQHLDCAVSTKGPDQWLYNLFVTSKDVNGKLKILLTPWDMDRTWGEGFDDETLYDIDPEYNVLMEYNAVSRLIELNDSKIKKLVKDRYDELRSSTWSNEYILNMLLSYEDDIFNSGAYLRDIERWPDSYQIDNSIGLSQFKDYVINRLTYLDQYMADNY